VILYLDTSALVKLFADEPGSDRVRVAAECTYSWHRLDVIAADWPLIQRAGQLAVEHGLRGHDSVHLAAAEAVWTRVRGSADFRFAVFDEGLTAAAGRIGMELIAS
jgi:uncharacterized protein